MLEPSWPAPALACVVVRAVVVHRRDVDTIVGGCDKPSHGVVLGVGLAGRTTWPSRRTGAGLADVIRRLGSWAVLELHLPELGIRSRRRHADG